MRSSAATSSSFERVKIRNVFHKALVHQLIDNFFAEAVDIHGVAAGVMEQRLFAFCRARGVHATVSNLALDVVNRAVAFGTMLGHAKRLAVLPFLDHFQDVRNHFAGALDQHGVADLQAEPLDLIHIVERGTADSDASDLHRFENGDGRERAGAANLHDDVVDDGGFLPRGIFVSDGPARSAGSKAQFVLNGVRN